MIHARSILLLAVLVFATPCLPAAARAADADKAPADLAAELTKEGKHDAAARVLLDAAEKATSDEAAELRYQAALSLQRARDLAGAKEQHLQVSGDRAAAVSLRMLARSQAELIHWYEELDAVRVASEAEVELLRSDGASQKERVHAFAAKTSDALARLKKTEKQLKDNRKKIVDLVGPDDPMVKELDELLATYGGQKTNAAALAKGASAVKKDLSAVLGAVSKVEKAAGALAKQLAASQAALQKGEGSANKLKGLRSLVLDKTGKAADAALAAVKQGGSGSDRIALALDGLEPKLVELVQIVGVGELLLGQSE